KQLTKHLVYSKSQFLLHQLLLFCFQRHLHPRHLPSFPTRRSSDLFLIRASGPVHKCAWEIIWTSYGLDTRIDTRIRVSRPYEVQDRKSTRLNSSHSQISYAVFCLKKKNGKPLDYGGNDATIKAHDP